MPLLFLGPMRAAGQQPLVTTPVVDYDFTDLPVGAGVSLTRAGAGASYRGTNGVMVTAGANVARFHHNQSGVFQGVRYEPFTRVNKLTADNANPTEIDAGFGYNEDPPFLVELVDPPQAAIDAGLATVCSKVYRVINNTANQWRLTFPGTTGNTNPHTATIWAWCSPGTNGGGIWRDWGSDFEVLFNNTAPQRIARQNWIPTNSGKRMRLSINGGETIWFCLFDLVEQAFQSAELPGDELSTNPDALSFANVPDDTYNTVTLQTRNNSYLAGPVVVSGGYDLGALDDFPAASQETLLKGLSFSKSGTPPPPPPPPPTTIVTQGFYANTGNEHGASVEGSGKLSSVPDSYWDWVLNPLVRGAMLVPSWPHVEPSKGSYRWEVIDYARNQIAIRDPSKLLWVRWSIQAFGGNAQVPSRILPDYIRNETDGVDYGGLGPPLGGLSLKRNSTTDYSVRRDHPNIRARMQAFIVAFMERYDGDSIVTSFTLPESNLQLTNAEVNGQDTVDALSEWASAVTATGSTVEYGQGINFITGLSQNDTTAAADDLRDHYAALGGRVQGGGPDLRYDPWNSSEQSGIIPLYNSYSGRGDTTQDGISWEEAGVKTSFEQQSTGHLWAGGNTTSSFAAGAAQINYGLDVLNMHKFGCVNFAPSGTRLGLQGYLDQVADDPRLTQWAQGLPYE